jgi:hypothetical protein
MKLTRANPTYLQARDAIMDALDDKWQAENWAPAWVRLRLDAWRAFAKYGMGVRAVAGSSLDFKGIRADFRVSNYAATIYSVTENWMDATSGRVTPSGDLQWHRHDGRDDGVDAWHPASGDHRIGHSWNFPHVFGAGQGVVYALTERTVDPVTGRPRGGNLLWYRHDGWRDGKDEWTTRPDSPVARNWAYLHVFSGGDGVIFGIRDNGDLVWHRHDGWRDGSHRWTEPVDPTIGTGWNYPQVFSGGNGILYAVTERKFDPVTGRITGGDLVWFRHDGWRQGSKNRTAGMKVVQRRWKSAHTFSGGDGIIYALQDDGRLLWHRHEGWHDGSARWAPGSGQPVGDRLSARQHIFTS